MKERDDFEKLLAAHEGEFSYYPDPSFPLWVHDPNTGDNLYFKDAHLRDFVAVELVASLQDDQWATGVTRVASGTLTHMCVHDKNAVGMPSTPFGYKLLPLELIKED